MTAKGIRRRGTGFSNTAARISIGKYRFLKIFHWNLIWSLSTITLNGLATVGTVQLWSILHCWVDVMCRRDYEITRNCRMSSGLMSLWTCARDSAPCYTCNFHVMLPVPTPLHDTRVNDPETLFHFTWTLHCDHGETQDHSLSGGMIVSGDLEPNGCWCHYPAGLWLVVSNLVLCTLAGVPNFVCVCHKLCPPCQTRQFVAPHANMSSPMQACHTVWPGCTPGLLGQLGVG